MKVASFKKFLEEEDSKAIVQTGLNSKSINNSVTKEILNSRLANATSNSFITPYIALGSIARVLAYANIIVPQYTFLDRDEGEVVFDATQVGQIAGVNLDGSPARTEADHFIYFSYSMNDDGYYDCFAALVDSDELERIMDMGGDDDVDQFDVDQKVNEEAIDKAEDYYAGLRPSLKSNPFKHTDETGATHSLKFNPDSSITYHSTGKSHPNMKPKYVNGQKSHDTALHQATRDFQRHVLKGIDEARRMQRFKEELKGDQHKLDVAEPKGKLTSADFKKLRGEEAIDEVNYSAKNAAAGKDIGKPGKNFAKIAKAASERYGSKESGERVAGAILKNLRKKK